tara:strand:+ start:75993 stop:77069 length:1077 start_codon:yes stop_codon:yes gene_type:complete
MTAYYNENDPYAAQWLRNLIAANVIAPGDVDERSILDVRPSDLDGYIQCHFFAGIGVWSYAARKAGWPDNRPLWTGSCPCGPFSQAGQRKGFDDERHLWPYWHYLIDQHQPDTVFGEQVASKDGLAWLDLVCADMEGTNYAFAAPDLCSAGVGAPNIRQRIFFVANANGLRRTGIRRSEKKGITEYSETCKLANAESRRKRPQPSNKGEFRSHRGCSKNGSLANSNHNRFSAVASHECQDTKRHAKSCRSDDMLDNIERPGPVNGFWRDADWIFCKDERWRPIEPGTFPLAPGLTRDLEQGRTKQERMAIRAARTYRRGTLRGYGNAINAELATTFIQEAMICLDDFADIEGTNNGKC